MKKYFKDTWVSYVTALTISYMFFIFEPIQLYSNNINDFWFDLNNIIFPTFLVFMITFIAIVIINNILYFFNKKFFNIFIIIIFVCFLCTYIQGNYLVGNLPVLDGTPIDWNSYKIDMIISCLLWIIIILSTIILCKKFKTQLYIKYSGYLVLAIMVMLSSSLITTLCTTDVLKQKQREVISTTTTKNINKYSNDDNFIILLIDAVDSRQFARAIKDNPKMSNNLNDFTYYPDTMSMHTFTRESLPLILSGVVYENQSQFVDYVIDSMKKSVLLNKLYNNDYEVNIYEPELYFYDKDALKIANVVNSSKDGNLQIDNKEYIKEEIRYDLFRYLPFFLKKYSKIEYLNFTDTKLKSDGETPFVAENMEFVHTLNNSMETGQKKNFKFIHLDGAHVPFTINKNLEIGVNYNYYDEVEGCLNITNKYLQYLKDNGVYDNSKIIIMADHGYAMDSKGEGTLEGRQNPIFLIKGKNETHKNIVESSKPISFVDLDNIYENLIDNKKGEDVVNFIDNNRTRRFLLYRYTIENHMYEYETKGKAWETNKMYATGKEFIRQ